MNTSDLKEKYSESEMNTFQSILDILSKGNVDQSRQVFSALSAHTINRFRQFRHDLRCYTQKQPVTSQ